MECVGAAEHYDGRARLAKEICRKEIFTTRDYRELLARPGLDAVIVATPDHWHAKLMEDCCAAGKDVYCEKPMSQVAEEGPRMIAAAKKHKRVIQIGSAGISSVVSLKAREIVASGALGRLTLVEATQGRNSPGGAWRYPVPPDASPRTIDWENWLGKASSRPFNAIHWARWRCWKDYGTGVAGDLFVHMITSIHYITGTEEPPLRAQSTGGIFRFNDGRDVPDTLATVFTYRRFPLYMRISQGSASPRTIRFLGTKGVMELGGGGLTFTPQDGKDRGPSSFARAWPQELREAYLAKWRDDNNPKPGQSTVASDSQRYVAPRGHSGSIEHFHDFFTAVRTRGGTIEDATFGHNAAMGCHMANYAYFNNTIATWDSAANKIRG
ncbi:MAG: Gfo/Idh/MocA family oxidoreductase [Acidobacteria bacterium]|nr:Gfo/Idh/MocA family oxidoreductase [Acidobacteriota bacterium]